MLNRRRVQVQCAFLAITAIAAAQDRPNGFFLTTPLSLSNGYDDGFIAGSTPRNDDITLLTSPTFEWMRSTHRADFLVNYLAEFEMFSHNPGLDAWNHQAAMRYLYRINARWNFDAGDLFYSTNDSSRQLGNSLLLLPRGRFLQNASYAGLGYRVNQLTKITFRFDNVATNTDLPGSLAGRLDGVTSAGTVTVDRILTSHHKLSGSYSFLHSHPLNPQVSGTGTNVHLLNLEYTYEINPGLIVLLAGGTAQGHESSFIGVATVQKKVKEMWIAGGYQRYLSFFGGAAPLNAAPPVAQNFAEGVTPNAVYQVATVRAWGELSKRWSLEGVAQRALNGGDPRFPAIRSVVGQVRVAYKLNDRVSCFIRAEHYSQNANSFLNIPLGRNRYFGGLEFALTRPPETESSRVRRRKLAQDEEQLQEAHPEEK